jgi:hypothetical protein
MDQPESVPDVLFENKDVCILNPKLERGIVVFSLSDSENICSEGILSYNKLKETHPRLNLPDRTAVHIDPDHNDLIFFRAPYNSDTSTFENSYGVNSPIDLKKKNIALIRIDPEKTQVYSSAVRARPYATNNHLQATRISMYDYLDIIKQNEDEHHTSFRANILTYKKEFFRKDENEQGDFKMYDDDDDDFDNKHMDPWITDFPIERMAEVVVKLPIIRKEWLVACITTEPKKDGGSKPPHKSKVIYGGRAYKVRKEDRRKYILVKGIKTYLGEIRGQYKYKKDKSTPKN